VADGRTSGQKLVAAAAVVQAGGVQQRGFGLQQNRLQHPRLLSVVERPSAEDAAPYRSLTVPDGRADRVEPRGPRRSGPREFVGGWRFVLYCQPRHERSRLKPLLPRTSKHGTGQFREHTASLSAPARTA
jgi:hypothetical protein